MYKINITITNERGDELLVKQLKIHNLENILDTDLSALYAETQQNELFDLGEIPEYDETDSYRETI